MIRLAEIFQNNMILQRRKPIRIWGNSDCPQNISISWNGDIILAVEVSKGPFEWFLPEREAEENGTLCIESGDGQQIALHNVDIGEVWIAGGQSNMEFALRFEKNGELEIRQAKDEHLRYFEVGKYSFAGEAEEGIKDPSRWNKWISYQSTTAPWFSAVGVYFAKRLRQELEVPVAIVSCNWGGTKAAAWCNKEFLRQNPELEHLVTEYETAVKKLDMEKYLASSLHVRKLTANPKVIEKQDRIMKNEANKAPGFIQKKIAAWYGKFQNTGPHDQNRPGGLFENMILKIAGFSCQGVIWYQGESDEYHARLYSKLFRTVIASWSEAWKTPLPFLYVQLAPFEVWQGCTGVNFPVVREQQQLVEMQEENCWMVSIMDTGSRYDIHPKEKKAAGERLALLALGKRYGKEILCEAPRMKQIHREKNQLRLTFDHAGTGLTAAGDIRELFSVTGDGKQIACEAMIEGNTVILKAQELERAVTIEVAFADVPFCTMTLYGGNHLAARPFAPVCIR